MCRARVPSYRTAHLLYLSILNTRTQLHAMNACALRHRPLHVQAGAVRTNCIDCLDRTNVMQGVLGRKVRGGPQRRRCCVGRRGQGAVVLQRGGLRSELRWEGPGPLPPKRC